MKRLSALVFLWSLVCWAVGAQALAPQRTWTISANNSVPASLTHTEQFQEEIYRFKTLLVASGGTIERSNGTVSGVATAGAADNIPDRAGVTMGAAGTGAWFVVSWTNLGGGVVRCLWDVADATDPRQVFNHRCGNATWTGGTTTALPTTGTGFAYATVTETAFIPYTATTQAYWSSWRSTNNSGAQSIRFLYKAGGASVSAGPITFVTIEGNTDADGGGTMNQGERWAVGIVGLFAVSTLQADWMSGLGPTAGVGETRRAVAGLWTLAGSWTSGLTATAVQAVQPLLFGCSTAATGRTLGYWVDMFAIPGQSVTGTYTDSAEGSQNPRRMNFGAVSMYWPPATSVL